MRMLVFFDLPVVTKTERRAYTVFRRFLLNDGYDMIQFSVYGRILNGSDAVEKHMQRLLPEREAQHPAMKISSGKTKNCICQRMLAKQIGFYDIGQQAAGPGNAHADPAGLVNRPVQQHQGKKVRAQCQRKSG